MSDPRSTVRIPQRERRYARRAIVFDVYQLMPDDSSQAEGKSEDADAHQPRAAHGAIRRSTGDEHRCESREQLFSRGVAENACQAALLQAKGRNRIEREREPCGQVTRKQWRVGAPEPREGKTGGHGDGQERRDGAGLLRGAISFPRRHVVRPVGALVDGARVDRRGRDREKQRQRAGPQRDHGDVQDDRGRIEGRQNRDELVIPPLVRANDADQIVADETRIAQCDLSS